MKFNKKVFISLLLFTLIFLCSCVSAEDADNVNVTLTQENQSINSDDNILEKPIYQEELQNEESDEIVVNDWNELQYYCSLTDKDYILRLKENTNFYPTSPTDSNCQIKINNNVKIIGSNGSYFGDSAFHRCYIPSDGYRYIVEGGEFVTYTPIIVPDYNHKSLTLENITFKWIYLQYSPDSKFIQLGGAGNYKIKNCHFDYINTILGNGAVILLKRGKAILENCSFINCTVPKGVITISEGQNMVIENGYFENNFAYEHTTCIMNWGNVAIYNTKFFKNRSAAWAGGITTYGAGVTNIHNCNFTDNVAGWNGGALYVYNIVNIYNTTFEGNNCTTNNGGGAIGACQYSGIPRLYVDNCLFKDNNNNCWALDELSTEGTGRGGAISFMDKGSIEVRNSVFIANSASIATAICAWEAGSYGSPDIYIINNTFINHTRAGDVLNVKVIGTECIVSGNNYIGNSIEFSNLTLTPLNVGKEQATLQVSASLSHPNYYEKDILDRTLYDVYINNKYVKTVNSTVFTIYFGDLDICDVYVIPTISNRKTNNVTLISTREYVFVSKNGSDINDGKSRSTPVSTIKKALELAKDCKNIILLDGSYSEDNLQINYNIQIKGENNATLTDKTSFVLNSNFTLKNIQISNLNSDFIKQNTGWLIIENCVLSNNIATYLIDAKYAQISKSIITNNNALVINNNGYTSIKDSIILNNTDIVNTNSNYTLDYNWWGNTLDNLSKPFSNINNWLVLNATANVNALEVNQATLINLAFYLNDSQKYTNVPEINFKLSALNGNMVKNSNSRLTFTLTALEDGQVTISYNDVYYNIDFKFLKSSPNLSAKSSDIMVGDDLILEVKLPGDAKGTLTVSVSNVSQSKNASDILSFNFTGLKAGSYIIKTLYSGDDKYLPQNMSCEVLISKYPSKTTLNLSEIEVGCDVLITVSCLSDATGNVTLKINNNVQTLKLSDAKAFYTMKNVTRGDYKITAIYNGDDTYLTSSDSKFIEVDNLVSEMEIIIDDIFYGETAIVTVKLNDNATGNVTVTVDGVSNTSDVVNGQSEIFLSNLEAGLKNVTVFFTGDDTYFNLTKTGNFTIAKSNLTFKMSSSDIKIGQDVIIKIKVPPKTSGTFTIGNDIINIPLSGDIEYVISDLEIGDYDITAVYDGNNYNTVMNSTSFSVLEYPSPQWSNVGFNSQNNAKSPYDTSANGEVLFTLQIGGDILIDSEGNLYISTSDGIYSFDLNGNLRWIFNNSDVLGNYSGIVIGRDIVISPKTGDTLYFINQTTGERYGSSNIYQGSSNFAPVMDANANIYISSEYQVTSGSYKLVIVPFKLWEFGGNPTIVDLGKNSPLTSPVANDEIIVVLSENRLRVIDAKTLQTKFIKSGDYAPIKPIIGEGNVVYAVLGDSIVAYSVYGSQLWKSKVTGGIKDKLVIDSDSGLYALNSKGNLYRYDLTTGKESLVSNLEITSGILVGNDGVLYFAVDDIFYSVDSEGNVLWKSQLDSKISGNPVMDKNGTIYVSADDKIYALGHCSLKDPNLAAGIINNTLVISIDNQTTGDVSFTVKGVRYENIFTKSILDLDDGDYGINVTYVGDARFVGTSKVVDFTVKTRLACANVNMLYTSGDHYKVRLTKNDIPLSGKTISFTINGKKVISKTNKDGYASVKITLPPKTYAVKATYGNVTITKKVTVKSIITAKNINAKKSAKAVKIKVTLKMVNKKYLKNKKITLKFNKKTFKAKTNKKGVATFTIKNSVYKKLKTNKKYTYQVIYGKDNVKKTIKFKK
ncbi:Ig-like domain repeat protein [Methanobrevibacter thaueri]|uniref:Pyrrolo-quinoline quinone repeat domain-containing protein n=1 Tax=Methanobrevibacter thaueri TaxID=190975 RepID=A0A315YCE6_9EURY|nr:Ig-like domain repeat protein [Methanobrevibacter thaueri]PWB88282.1 hypothetical protein MBBTH_01260 [Methanobrevibacter thaueri]